MRRLLVAILLIAPIVVEASGMPYTDVLPDAWYIEEVQSFLDQGYLDGTQTAFRAGDRSTRAEFIKLIVEVNGGILDEIPAESAFGDVAPGAWYFGYLEESAREGWTRGDNNCYAIENRGSLSARSCHVRPNDSISRAEAAVLVQRAFGRKRLGKAPAFADNPGGEWYTDAVQAAADHCILRGDDGTRNVRPFDPVNRAEMVAMLFRVDGGGEYPECLL